MNTNLNQIKQQQGLKKKAISLLSKAFAKIILKFRLPRAEIMNALDEQLVLQAKRQDPDASNVAIAIRTGIDRRYISKHLNGEMPDSKPNKMAIILEDIRWTAHKYYQSNKIPKFGPFKTFQSICEERAPGSLTLNSILEELINNGNLKDLEGKIEIINTKSKTIANEVNFSQITATQVNRVVDTIIHNSEAPTIDEKYVQRTTYSTQINPDKFVQLHHEIKKSVDQFNIEITDLLVSYEENVNVGTHPEYGVSFLEYTIENRE